MEITGRLHQKLAPETGTAKNGNAWIKQRIVVETIEQYPKKVAIDFMGDQKVETINRLFEGDEVKVGINLESREYQGKWYTNVNGWKIDILSSATPQQTQAPQAQPQAATAKATSASTLSPNTAFDNTTDDLPF